MKNKGLLLKLLTCVLLIPCFVIPFVSVFAGVSVTGSLSTDLGGYGIFGDYSTLETAMALRNAEIAPFWMTLVSIMVVALAVLALLYVVLLVLELLKVKCKVLCKLQKFVSFLIFVCAVVALVGAIVATAVNAVALESVTSYAKLVFAIGAWLLIAPVVAGIVGLMAKETKSKSKKK